MVLTENIVWSRILEVANLGVAAMGIEGYEVAQHSQASNVSSNRCLLVAKVGGHRLGWVSEHYVKEHPNKDMVNEFVEWTDEITFQFSAFADRTLADDKETISPFDVVDLLSVWLNSSRGVEECRSRGLQPLRVTELRRPPVQSDSTQYDFNPNFDCSFAIPQSVWFDVPTLKVVKLRHTDECGAFDVVDAQFYDAEGRKKRDLTPEELNELKGLVKDGDTD